MRVLLVLLAVSPFCRGATNTVSNLSDELQPGSLRFTIANSAANDVIVFDRTAIGTILLSRGALVIDKPLKIEGLGPTWTKISANQKSRIFVITNASVSISGFTIRQGRVIAADGASGSPPGDAEAAFGGAILNINSSAGHTLAISECIFEENTVTGGTGGSAPFGTAGRAGNAYGGAIFNNDRLIVVNSAFVENTASGGTGGGAGSMGHNGGAAAGGAVCNIGIMALTNCTFTVNSVGGGDGGYGGQFFGGDGGEGEGAAICNAAQLTVQSCTFSRNTATGGRPDSSKMSGRRGGAFGGGIRNVSGTAIVRNTIIAGNTAGSAPDLSGDFTSEGFNLVGNSTGSTGFGAIFDQVGTASAPIDPVLHNYYDTSEVTPTIGLRLGSPAIDKGNSFGAGRDQRGAPRPSPANSNAHPGDGSDIGAYEFIPPLLTITQFANYKTISWSAFVSGFLLQRSTDPGSTNWATVFESFYGFRGGRMNYTTTNSAPMDFFRLTPN